MAEESQSQSVPEPDGIEEALSQSMKNQNVKSPLSKGIQIFKGLQSILQDPNEGALPATIDQPNEPSIIAQDIVLTWEQVKADFESRVKVGEIPPAEEAQYLFSLANHYECLYEKDTDDWTAQLRAHSLYISCSLRDEASTYMYTKSALRMMKCFFNEDILLDVMKSNKKELREMRQKYKAEVVVIKNELLPTIDGKILENNHDFMFEFSQRVQTLSSEVTNELKTFISKLVDQSVEQVGSRPPCGIAFVAIGSLAREEATPYSDVEYLFLVESNGNQEYFRKLAYQTYFAIGNIGETNLQTMNISELKGIRFQDSFPKGIRIDGLGSKAGNIPTGSAVNTRNELIFTVEELVTRYQLILEGNWDSEDKGVSSDLVDMLAHRTTVWSYGNVEDLVDQLNAQLLSVPHTPERRVKATEILQEDLERYNFWPVAKSLP